MGLIVGLLIGFIGGIAIGVSAMASERNKMKTAARNAGFELIEIDSHWEIIPGGDK